MAQDKSNKQQRIKLRIAGSPVKFDGTIIEASPDGKRIVVEFDGPLETKELFAYGEYKMCSDMVDSGGNFTNDVRLAVKAQWWEVL